MAGRMSIGRGSRVGCRKNGLGGSVGGTIENQQKGQVVGLAGAAREILDGLKQDLLQEVEWSFVVAGQKLHQARNAEQFFLRIHSFGDPVTEKHEGIAGLKLDASGGVLRFGDQPYRERSLLETFLGGTIAADENGRRVAGVDVLEGA